MEAFRSQRRRRDAIKVAAADADEAGGETGPKAGRLSGGAAHRDPDRLVSVSEVTG